MLVVIDMEALHVVGVLAVAVAVVDALAVVDVAPGKAEVDIVADTIKKPTKMIVERTELLTAVQ